jgi:CheY-like chemotaxis protein
VLVVEDVKINQEIAKSMLEMLGANVALASNGREAVIALQNERFDIVFMDCQMPEMDGFEAVRAIRAQERETGAESTPVIALTAGGEQSERGRAIEAGMDDYINKPFTLKDIKSCLERFLKDPDGTRLKLAIRKSAATHPENNENRHQQLSSDTKRHIMATEVIDGILNVEEQTGNVLLPELLRGFLDQAEQKEAELFHAIHNEDREQLRRVAHAIKSMSASLGAEQIRALFEDIEKHHNEVSRDTAEYAARRLCEFSKEFIEAASEYREGRILNR